MAVFQPTDVLPRSQEYRLTITTPGDNKSVFLKGELTYNAEDSAKATPMIKFFVDDKIEIKGESTITVTIQAPRGSQPQQQIRVSADDIRKAVGMEEAEQRMGLLVDRQLKRYYSAQCRIVGRSFPVFLQEAISYRLVGSSSSQHYLSSSERCQDSANIELVENMNRVAKGNPENLVNMIFLYTKFATDDDVKDLCGMLKAIGFTDEQLPTIK